MEEPHPVAEMLRLSPIVEMGDDILSADEERAARPLGNRHQFRRDHPVRYRPQLDLAFLGFRLQARARTISSPMRNFSPRQFSTSSKTGRDARRTMAGAVATLVEPCAPLVDKRAKFVIANYSHKDGLHFDRGAIGGAMPALSTGRRSWRSCWSSTTSFVRTGEATGDAPAAARTVTANGAQR